MPPPTSRPTYSSWPTPYVGMAMSYSSTLLNSLDTAKQKSGLPDREPALLLSGSSEVKGYMVLFILLLLELRLGTTSLDCRRRCCGISGCSRTSGSEVGDCSGVPATGAVPTGSRLGWAS